MDHNMQRKVIAITGGVFLAGAGVGQALAGTVQHCSTTAMAIPDHNQNEPGILVDTISLEGSELISDLRVKVNADHPWVGDLRIKLRHNAGPEVTLMNKTGLDGLGDCNASQIDVEFSDNASSSAESICHMAGEAVSIVGSITPVAAEFLGDFDEETLGGDWTLTVEDKFPSDAGILNSWCLTATVAGTNGPAVVFSPSSGLVTSEPGGSVDVRVMLDQAPSADVILTLSSSDTAEGTVTPDTLIFTPANWNIEQVITITGVEDIVDDGDKPYEISVSLSSADTGYGSLAVPSLAVTNQDNDPIYTEVPVGHWAYEWIQTLTNTGITSGCGTGMYCPDNDVSRAEMAVFLGRSMYGVNQPPPAPTGTVFSDVPVTYWAADFIERLAADGVTNGCGGGMYCPEVDVTRASMAVFLLRAKYGASYEPPLATGTRFDDVPSGHWAAAWIEQLAKEGITSGCNATSYCPDKEVQRDAMAVFLVKTFDL